MTGRVPFDSLTLMAVVDELRSALIGGRIQHISQLTDTSIVISVRCARASRHLMLAWDAQSARAHLVSDRARSRPQPPAFTMALRKHLEGARIAGVDQLGFDRVLELHAIAGDREYCLIGEFMGRHSNVVLTADNGIILAPAKAVDERQNRYRVVLPNRAYSHPPPPRGALDPFAGPPRPAELAGKAADEIAKYLVEAYAGMSPFLASLIAQRALQLGIVEAWSSVFGVAVASAWRPVLVRDASGLPCGGYPIEVHGLDGLIATPFPSISMALDTAWREIVEVRAKSARMREMRMALLDALGWRQKRLGSLEEELQGTREAEKLRRDADLLMAAGPALRREGDTALVPDHYSDGSVVAIPLRTGRTPVETAQMLYDRARKLERQRVHLEAERVRVASELDELASLAARLAARLGDAPQDSSTEEEFAALVSRGIVRPSLTAAAPKHDTVRAAEPGVRRIVTPEGYEILVGLSAEGNKRVLQLSAPDDIWFHVRSGSSAHAVIRTARQPDRVPSGVLYRAAREAARRSAAKHSRYVAVDYTLRKYVRPLGGAKAGKVLYRNEHTLEVDPNAPERNEPL